MRGQDRDQGAGIGMETIMQVMRLVGALLGAIAITMGLVYVTRVFHMVYTVLRSPDGLQGHIDKWITAVGGPELDLVVEGTTIHASNAVAIAVMGGGVLILSWLALALVFAGAKVLAWTLGDVAAVKRILRHAFGPTMKPTALGGE